MRQLIELTGLWEGKDKKGSLTLSGPLGSKGEIVIFRNYLQKNSSQPDYKLYLCLKNKRTPFAIEDDEFSLNVFREREEIYDPDLDDDPEDLSDVIPPF